MRLGNIDTVTCDPGDVLHIHSPGGGGRGNPMDRDPARVQLDVARGYVSVGAAEAEYGVVLRDGAVDAVATERRRRAMRGEQRNAHFAFGPEREHHEAVWTDANYAALNEILTMLPVHWRFFVKTRLFERAPQAAVPTNRPWVKQAFEELCESYPDLAAVL